MLQNNIRDYYRETLENELPKIGISKPDKVAEITKTIIDKLTKLNESAIIRLQLPDNFFDMGLATRIIARRLGITPEKVAANFGEYINDLFDINELSGGHPAPEQENAETQEGHKPHRPGDKRVKPRLSDDEIGRIAYNIKEETGRAPTTSSGHDGLPEGVAGWAIIIADLRSRDLTPRKLIDKHRETLSPEEQSAIDISQTKNKPCLTDAEIGRIAYDIKNRTGRVPGMSSGHDGLPEGVTGWPTIIRNLPSRGLTLGKLIQAHIETLPPEEQASLTINKTCLTDAEIGRIANETRKETGRTPEMSSEHDGLPEDVIFEKPAEPLQSASKEIGLPASVIFHAAAQFIIANDRALKLDDTLNLGAHGNIEAKDISAVIESGEAYNVHRFVPAGSKSPRDLQEFMLFSGLARVEAGQIVAADKAVIQGLIKTYG